MSVPGLLSVLLLGAADPCAQPAELESAARESPERFGAAIARVEADLGVPLLRSTDTTLSTPEQAKLARERLEAACALKARPAPTSVTPDRARLKAILDSPEFHQARDRDGDTLQRWMRKLVQWLDELFETKQAQSYSEVTRTLVLALAVAAVAGGALRLLQRRRAPRASAPSPSAAAALKLDSPREHLTRGQAMLEADPREAIREGLFGLLSGLERRRWARPDRVKTNRELAAELPTRGAPAELTTQVTELLRWYDRAFYSLEPVPVGEARTFLERVERLDASLGGTP
jgi:hypothetical protein